MATGSIHRHHTCEYQDTEVGLELKGYIYSIYIPLVELINQARIREGKKNGWRGGGNFFPRDEAPSHTDRYRLI